MSRLYENLDFCVLFPNSYKEDSNMLWDVLEQDLTYTILVDLPGVSKENISVEASQGILKISAERPQRADGKYLVKERKAFEFKRTLKLPKDANHNSVSAVYKDGVLGINVEKFLILPPKKKIEVRVD